MGLIRFLLACVVVLGHTAALFGYRPISSDLAVQCFYMISGFYMALILNEKYKKGSNRLFYKNRALKIYPIYWVVLMLLVGWGLLVYAKGYPGTVAYYAQASPLSAGAWLYFVFANICIISLDLVWVLGIKQGNLYFTSNYAALNPNVYHFGFNSYGWTLGVELLFYMIAPFILRRRWHIVALILLGSLFIRIVLAVNGLSGHPWDYMFFPTQLMFFMAGGLAYRIYLWMQRQTINRFYLKLCFALFTAVVLLYDYAFKNSYYKEACFFTGMIPLMPAAFIATKNSRADRYLGNLSYPIYISQILVTNIYGAKAFPKFGGGFTALAAVIIISLLLEYFIARPIEKMRQQPFSKSSAALAETGV